jgi:type I restriction enzyme R subunit
MYFGWKPKSRFFDGLRLEEWDAMGDSMLTFKPFDERGAVRIYCNGFLPHWRQAGCTYFVTFRLADSIPQDVLDQWTFERETWLSARGVVFSDPTWQAKFQRIPAADKLLFERRFVTKFFVELDRGRGDCVLRDPAVANLVRGAMLHFHGEKVHVDDFVIMPNHVHALLTPIGDFEFEDVLHFIKSYTSNQIQKHLKTAGTLWMKVRW